MVVFKSFFTTINPEDHKRLFIYLFEKWKEWEAHMNFCGWYTGWFLWTFQSPPCWFTRFYFTKKKFISLELFQFLKHIWLDYWQKQPWCINLLRIRFNMYRVRTFFFYCIVLYCIVFSCLVLFFIVLSCILFYRIFLSYIVLYCIVLSCLVLSCFLLSVLLIHFINHLPI